jgi:catecholate siderophore receptor
VRKLTTCLLGCALGALCPLATRVAGAQTAADTTARRAADSTARRAADRPAQTLRPVVVAGDAARRRAAYAPSAASAALRSDVPLRDAPQSVSVVTRELIADQGMQSMADVARYIPGVSKGQGEGHRDAPTIRGNSSTADFFVDGVRDDAQYLRDLYNVDRVEALKGSNAMLFGRGGGGGIINRVTKEARWTPTRALTLEGGSFDHNRATLDLGQPITGALAARLNGMVERSGGFRDESGLARWGVNPTAALVVGSRTLVRAGYEYFHDDRTVDRGIPSFGGRPSDVDRATFFGDPNVNDSWANVHAASAAVEHRPSERVTLRNRTRFADHDKFYRNIFPGAVNAAGTRVNLSAYDHAIGRRNLFNQTEATLAAATGAVKHTLLVGAEVGRQETSQLRHTGYFGDSSTSFGVALDRPVIGAPVIFRQSATDADNETTARVAALYAQEQLELSTHWQAVAGLRWERFDVAFLDHRTGDRLRRADHLLSPRAGLVFKPVEPLSFYGSFGVSYLPSSGDQFGSLTVTSSVLEPERFINREVGAKWDVRPALSLTAALYRLDRTNTSAPDPLDASRTVQTGRSRSSGFELGLLGQVTDAWQLAGGWATQRATIESATDRARAGATVPLVPHHTLSLWNRVRIAPALGLGLGVVHQADMYAAVDNAVVLPGFTRADGAVYLTIAPRLRAQINVENLLDARYFATSLGNNTFRPGAPGRAGVANTTAW